ncbi:MAG: uracil-DNA glycosylase [Bacteroidota bacterium]
MSHPAESVKIEEGWKKALYEEFAQPYFQQLKAFLIQERESRQTVYPPGKLIFNAFNKTPFEAVKVVILGQDPYHGPGQAHGLCFSVPREIKPPPSLINVYKELQTDVGMTIPNHGNLEVWADQGVFLLNSMLTVRAHQAGSHQKKGWEEFTTAAIQQLNDQREGLVFLLWGRYAQVKGAVIDQTRHLVLQAAHPSPFAAHKGFFGCRHFSQANAYLQQQGKTPINWQV